MDANEFLLHLLNVQPGNPRMDAARIAIEAIGANVNGGFPEGARGSYFEWHRPLYLALLALGGVDPRLAETLFAEELVRRVRSKNGDLEAEMLLAGADLLGTEPTRLAYNETYRTLRFETPPEAAERIFVGIVYRFGVTDRRSSDFADKIRGIIVDGIQRKLNGAKGEKYERLKCQLRETNALLTSFHAKRDEEMQKSTEVSKEPVEQKPATPATPEAAKKSTEPSKVAKLFENAADRIPPEERGNLASMLGA